MKDKVFLDTNILVYSYSANEIEKQETARKLITENNSYISTQVLQELSNTITRKFGFTFKATEIVIEEVLNNNFLHINTEKTIFEALNIANKYSFSFYDSVIISAAIESNSSILYSEDLNDGQIINDILKIINPFK